MGKLDGKVAVVTAGSSGMALASAKLFVQEGAYVFITGRDQQRLDQAVASIGHNVTGVQGDVANSDDLDRLFSTVEKEKGHVDVLFASAGGGARAPLGSVTPEQYRLTFDTTVGGTLFTVQKLLPLFRSGGSIILNGSIAASKAFLGSTLYSAAKAAVRSFARTWVLELNDRKIRVNVISPGPINTPAIQMTPPEVREKYKAMIPRKEFGTTDEIASVALFLASSDSSFINGSEVFVDGGSAQI